MAHDWGTQKLGQFIKNEQKEPVGALDPSKVTLPRPCTVCIVGASRGIGAGIAQAYALAGATNLILASRRTSGSEETATRCRNTTPLSPSELQVDIIACDITSPIAVADLAANITQRFGRLDVVVVNSGYSGPVVLDLTETDPTTFANAAMVNYVGTFHCAKYLLPLLRADSDPTRGPGAFITVSTMATLLVRGPIANAQYCVSKTAQLQLTEHIHEQQFSKHGIAAFAVHPGAVLTEMADESTPEVFRPYLTDSPDLCGGFCVWLTKQRAETDWLSGRFVSATWDVEDLMGKREEIVEKNLLKLQLGL